MATRPVALADLLYGGETLVAEASVGTARVAVTSHRVLVLAPDGPGPRFRAVDRPNVAGVTVRAGGDGPEALRAARFGAYALVLLGAGAVVDLDGVVPAVDPAVAGTLGGVATLVTTLGRLFALLDDLLLVAGGVALLGALAFAARYVLGRTPHLEVARVGADPLRVPVAHAAPADVADIEAALGTGSNPPGR